MIAKQAKELWYSRFIEQMIAYHTLFSSKQQGKTDCIKHRAGQALQLAPFV